ncbi:MAG: hypothetical protein JOY71_20715 [Acetobacteraceae bacterium]|nr:hypothetical protein [Acetobacteraceae bacterium]MBV8524514.1 hypothetical protein [Acetobacteraceae bacterium]
MVSAMERVEASRRIALVFSGMLHWARIMLGPTPRSTRKDTAYTPDWVCGSSIGAVTAAIIAGNPPERRIASLRRFWDAAADDI